MVAPKPPAIIMVRPSPPAVTIIAPRAPAVSILVTLTTAGAQGPPGPPGPEGQRGSLMIGGYVAQDSLPNPDNFFPNDYAFTEDGGIWEVITES